MESEARRRIRRAFLARNAVSPKLRGQYRRAVHAARVEREAKGAPPPEGVSPLVPPPGKRRGIGIVVFFALLPTLLLISVGAYVLPLLNTLETAVGQVSEPCVACDLATAAVSGPAVPTNTPNTQGVIVPLAATATRPPEPVFPKLEKNEPFTVLLLGVDSREGDAAPVHSDTMILAYVDPAAKRVNLMSIPRDLLVQQAGGRGPDKMSNVFANGEVMTPKFPRGGVGLVWATLEQNFGIKINYYAQVDFVGFRKIINAVGGITVDNPYPIKDDEYPTEDYQYTRVYFPAGIMHLNGEESLQYARTRHGDNDYFRNNRQQQVILAIREQAAKTNLFAQANELVAALASTVKTDIPQKDYLALAGLARNIGNDGIKQFSLNNLVYDSNDASGFYTMIDWTEARKLVKEFSTPYVNTDSAARQQAQGANTALRVVVQNGTTKPGLAKQWSDTLARQGYGRAGEGYMDAAPDRKGNISQTRVYCFGKNEETARVIAATMGLSFASIDMTSSRPGDIPSDTDIVVILGDDAREPATRG